MTDKWLFGSSHGITYYFSISFKRMKKQWHISGQESLASASPEYRARALEQQQTV
jgi:hypothetical protein